ncbi:phospholipid-transporting ATPase ABCA3-like isoform X3 [Centruroides vittatus]|uniref:phospholipid-transporting ATPase ABCA3-like isoform X3 n=1 Tax=Centruroides vittatus TaxID=120091 RepID=UPI00350F0CDC
MKLIAKGLSIKLNHLYILLWKNFIQQYRHPFVTLLELIVPLFFSALVLWMRGEIKSLYIHEPTVYESFSVDSLPDNLTPLADTSGMVYFTPTSSHVIEIMKNVKNKLKGLRIKGFKTENILEKVYLSDHLAAPLVFGSIVFPDEVNNTFFGCNVQVKIRPRAIPKGLINTIGEPSRSWKTSESFPLIQTPGPRAKNFSTGGDPGAGAQWKYLSSTASPDDTITLIEVMGMMLLDTVCHLIITWYIDAVCPGEYGIPQPYYFFFTKSYWTGKVKPSEIKFIHKDAAASNTFIEPDPINKKMGIQIKELSKMYNKGKTYAVKNISLNMYEGNITALLGHNGAGKSTTISILTGLFPPTSGTAIINDYDIVTDSNMVHTSLGICPQNNVLFEELTVKQHLQFFCKLKNYPKCDIKNEICNVLEKLDLTNKRDTMAKHLSGGMKRKLSVGIALIGGSKIVMLDEPTSGMDPFARRFIWDLLLEEKKTRTILLTTHFMEEADILGDRIAIMANGEIKCCGTSLFLKGKFGGGYNLTVVKESNCISERICNLVYETVPDSELKISTAAELKFCLPRKSGMNFEKLFDKLETNKKELNISSYGASITTMEEVFLKVDEYSSIGINPLLKEESKLKINYLANTLYEDKNTPYIDISVSKYNVKYMLYMQQLRALFLKKILNTFRNKWIMATQLFIPVLMIIATISIIKYIPDVTHAPPLELTLKHFGRTYVPYSVNCSNKLIEVIANNYQIILSKENNVYRIDNNLMDYLLNVANTDLSNFTLHFIIAAEFYCDQNSDIINVTALFNNQAYHSPAISLSALQNAILVSTLGSSHYHITSINHPLPRTLSEKTVSINQYNTDAFQYTQNTIFGLSFVMASFVIFVIKENSSKAKHLQIISGVNRFIFWFSTFIWDLLNYIMCGIFTLLSYIIFNIEAFYSLETQAALFLLYTIHGVAVIPLIYCLSFLFEVPSRAFIILSISYMFVGNALTIIISLLEIPFLNFKNIARPLDTVFALLSSPYCMGRSIGLLYKNYYYNKICDIPIVDIVCQNESSLIFEEVKSCCKDKCMSPSFCLDRTDNIYSWELPGLGKNIIFLCLHAILNFAMLIFIEKKGFKNLKKIYYIFKKKHDPIYPPPVTLDDDVKEESDRILNTELSELQKTDIVILKDLTKFYQRFCAVNKLTLGIKRGECFGLLGLNGAGKTTTFQMLTGDEPISSGDAYLDGISIKSQIFKIKHRIGYCPQFGGLIDILTGRETLTLFARLRGVPEREIPKQIFILSEMLLFTKHIDKLVKQLSDGNKKKLSTAVALMGDTPVVFLDEPTTGMDPVARRCLWNTLIAITKQGRSIILTSHSMEECETLCSRLVIMVNGQFCCLGSPQHLKNKYGQGLTLIVKVKRCITEDDTDFEAALTKHVKFQDNLIAFKNYMKDMFTNCVLKEEHENSVCYHLPDPKMPWAQIFGIMESIKPLYNIEDYTINQVTLEQIFLNFSREQRGN